jgi:hypothetical protein
MARKSKIEEFKLESFIDDILFENDGLAHTEIAKRCSLKAKTDIYNMAITRYLQSKNQVDQKVKKEVVVANKQRVLSNKNYILAVIDLLSKIHEQIRLAAASISNSIYRKFKYIKQANEIAKKLSSEYKDDPEGLEKIQVILDDFETFCFEYLKIKTKKGDIVPLTLNEAQKKLARTIFDCILQGKPVPIIIEYYSAVEPLS